MTERRHWGDWAAAHAQVLSIALFLLLACALFGWGTEAFLSQGNLLNLLRQAAPMLVVAVAMTFVVTTGGIDLSVGSIVALSSALVALALTAGVPWPLAAGGVLGLGAAIGAMQGWFVAAQGIPSFIVTLAGMLVFRGLTLWLLNGQNIGPFPKTFQSLSTGFIPDLFGVGKPNVTALVIVAVAAAAVVWIGWRARNRDAAFGMVPEPMVTTRSAPFTAAAAWSSATSSA